MTLTQYYHYNIKKYLKGINDYYKQKYIHKQMHFINDTERR